MAGSSNLDYDLIVVGGGPAGSTLATFVAMDGRRVLLLERDRLPRYQIGESLLPSTVHGICRLLGVWDEIHEARFMRKRGGTFRWGRAAEPWTFAFGASPDMAGSNYAFQVERAKFDHILLENARRKGVTVIEEAAVEDLIEQDGRVSGVRYLDVTGQRHVARAYYVADASGHQSRFYRRAGERLHSKFFQNVALFGYYEGGKRLPPPDEGNILCVAFDRGWFWYIPLSPTLTSVGAVLAREHAGSLQQGHEAALQGCIAECPMIGEYLAGARRVTEGMYGQIRARSDYSYANTQFWSPGLVLVGDSACFVDPVFSSGVHLATYSALLAARSINTCLRGGAVEEHSAFTEFERRYRREYGIFYDFLLAFYDMHQDTESYFWSARKVLASDERETEAFVRLVGGGGSAPHEFFATRATLGAALQVAMDATRQGRGFTDGIAEAQPLAPGFDLSSFGAHRKREGNQIVAQAAGRKEDDQALFDGGLIATRDGLAWRTSSGAPHVAS